MMVRGDEFLIEPTSDYDAWITGLRSIGYSSFDTSDVFSGSVRASYALGITAVNVSFASRDVSRAERTYRDIRIDGKDYYKAIFQISGHSKLIQNDGTAELAAGECGLVDMVRPSCLVTDDSQWLALYLPRRPLTYHLGMEPSGGVSWNGALLASRLLFRLVSDACCEGASSLASAEPYMQLAIYDLLGAMFSGSDVAVHLSHSDKLFARACRIVRNRFSDPDLSIQDIASEAGISLRYLQKLFTARGTTCGRYIQSLRLSHAMRLLSRRKLTRSKQPLAEIAYACGYGNYAHFSRSFRHRFGRAPSSSAQDLMGSGSMFDTESDRRPHKGGRLD